MIGFDHLPTRWQQTRLDRVADLNARIGWRALTAAEYQDDGFAFLSTPNIKSKQIDFENVNYISKFRYEESPELKLSIGDVLLVKDGNTLGITNVVTELPRAATVNGSIAVVRPFAIHGPFLRYALDSMVIQARIAAVKDGMGVPHLFQWDINRFPLPLPPVSEQRAIADYLDAETTRIDALITKKQQLMQLLGARRWAAFEGLVAATGAPLVPLRRLLTFLTDGPFGSAFSSSDYVPAGLGVLRLGNIGFARFRPENIVHLPLDRWQDFERYTVNAGDLVVAALGDSKNHAGRTCVAPALGPTIVKGKCFCARVDPDLADAEFVALSCSSPTARAEFGLTAQGSTRQMINLEIYRAHQIRLPMIAVQRQIASETAAIWDGLDRSIHAIATQVDLLSERRQALVTAAVTGDLRVPGVV